MKAVIDRFEGGWAVLEAEGQIMWNVPRQFLPPEAGEGDAIEFTFTIISQPEYNNKNLVDEIFE
ncbi:DUF3006 domain-containing protein [Desulforamulus hydrothermalis]|uniref:DUF3006 domain-containing protein n=1 Tax=Desulforamulus hydrothermalis Lam5 = DSM 18033 TaxID=1121428 RepID=K8DY43_9FIRM|nr:DUF3006 domain-containing protein [Desulforamulus hydrothermalis]CCO07654.1 conserved hypothetical protein [Desulforamulus hydrothermalis Lam5 = DSM 18033]SHH24623.1 Protein of unknown function [Desulforamulus hydrothermalis Lam5 = DSM 18033]